MSRLRWVIAGLATVLCGGAGAQAPAPAFSAGQAVLAFIDGMPRADAGEVPGQLRIDSLVITEPGGQDPIVSLRRGHSYTFWLRFSQPICAPYIDQIGIEKGGKPTFQLTWGNEEHYCGITGTGISVQIADDAPFGKYRWAGRSITYYGKDGELRAAFQVIDAP